MTTYAKHIAIKGSSRAEVPGAKRTGASNPEQKIKVSIYARRNYQKTVNTSPMRSLTRYLARPRLIWMQLQPGLARINSPSPKRTIRKNALLLKGPLKISARHLTWNLQNMTMLN
jgi:hypothetical protein